MRLFRQLLVVLAVLSVFGCVILLFTYDVIKLEWISFMEIQPSYRQMENPLPVPARSIPIEGPVTIPGMGAPENPMPGDEASIARGAELYAINCKMCHGDTGEGTGAVAPFLAAASGELGDTVRRQTQGLVKAGLIPALAEAAVA